MRILNIIFDLDGTLIDSARLTGAIVDTMLAKRGAEASANRALIRSMDAIGGEAMIAAALGAYSTDPAREIEEFRAIHRIVEVPSDLPFSGVRETLEALAAAGVGMAICSNKPQFLCERILSELDLARYFVAIVGSAPGRARKPAPQSALLALEAVSGTAANCSQVPASACPGSGARSSALPARVISGHP
jgi:phosphoglycolate phosphatase